MRIPMDQPLPQLDSTSPPAAPEAEHAHGVLRDSHERVIHDLRMSITDRCNFRCVYCMEPGDRFLPKRALLSASEYMTIVDAAIALGVRKVRLTGGEPTLYPVLDTIISELGRRNLDDIAMTTNGSLLDPTRTARWKAAGLTRLTFSLDTLREDRMTAITRSKTRVADVLRSIDVAAETGLARSKINVVAMRNFNEDEFADFADLAKEHSQCPSGAKGGDLGTFGPGQMVPEFDTVVFSDAVGQVHGPVQTQFGYHLIEITSRT